MANIRLSGYLLGLTPSCSFGSGVWGFKWDTIVGRNLIILSFQIHLFLIIQNYFHLPFLKCGLPLAIGWPQLFQALGVPVPGALIPMLQPEIESSSQDQ